MSSVTSTDFGLKLDCENLPAWIMKFKTHAMKHNVWHIFEKQSRFYLNEANQKQPAEKQKKAQELDEMHDKSNGPPFMELPKLNKEKTGAEFKEEYEKFKVLRDEWNQHEHHRKQYNVLNALVSDNISQYYMQMFSESKNAGEAVDKFIADWSSNSVQHQHNLRAKWNIILLKRGESAEGLLTRLDDAASKLEMAGVKLSDDEKVGRLMTAVGAYEDGTPSEFVNFFQNVIPGTSLMVVRNQLKMAFMTSGVMEGIMAAAKLRYAGQQRHALRTEAKPKFFKNKPYAKSDNKGKQKANVQNGDAEKCATCHKNHGSKPCWYNPANAHLRPKGFKINEVKTANSAVAATSMLVDSDSINEVTLYSSLKNASANLGKGVVKRELLIDSGCNRHMVGDEALLFPTKNGVYKSQVTSITVANGKRLIGDKIGDVIIQSLDGKINRRIENVLFVPGLSQNLIATSQFMKKGYEISMKKGECIIQDPTRPLTRLKAVENEQNLLVIQDKILINEKVYQYNENNIPSSIALSSNASELKLLHHRLGHLNHNHIKEAAKRGILKDLKIPGNISLEDLDICPGCQFGKAQNNKKTRIKKVRATAIGDVIHTDICGPMKFMSKGKKRYFITFTDEYSGYTWTRFLFAKSEAFEKFKDFNALFKNQFQTSIKILKSDQGGEYESNKFKQYCIENGILQRFTDGYASHQSGTAERKNRTLMEAARSMIFQASLPQVFWEEAVATATFLRNRSPSKRNPDWKSPFELLHKVKPSVIDLKIWGSEAYVKIPDEKLHKLSEKAERCIFLGYTDHHIGYLFSTFSGRRFTSRAAVFDEMKILNNNKHNHPHSTIEIAEEPVFDKTIEVPGVTSIPSLIEETLPFDLRRSTRLQQTNTHNDKDSQNNKEIKLFNTFPNTPYTHLQIGLDEPSPIPTGLLEPSENPIDLDLQQEEEEKVVDEDNKSLVDEEDEYLSDDDEDEVLTEDENESKDVNSIQALLAYALKAVEEKVSINEPKSYQEAISGSHCRDWKASMQVEFNEIVKNETWELVPPSKEIKAIGVKWVFKIKRDQNNQITRFKSRLVAQGFRQRQGFDVFETFAPTASQASLRMLLTIAAHNNWEIKQFDITNAFLLGILEEEVYVNQPPGFVVAGKENWVYRLKRSLYGLKQSPRVFNKRLTSEILKIGFIQSERDPCIFTRINNDEHTILLVFVDDLVITSNKPDVIDHHFEQLKQSGINIKNLGSLNWYLGIEITRDRDNRIIHLNQKTYIENMVKKFNLDFKEGCSVPLDPKVKLSKQMEPQTEKERREMKHVPYREAVGTLMFLAVSTRPDIATAVSIVSRYLNNPGKDHWNAVKCCGFQAHQQPSYIKS